MAMTPAQAPGPPPWWSRGTGPIPSLDQRLGSGLEGQAQPAGGDVGPPGPFCLVCRRGRGEEGGNREDALPPQHPQACPAPGVKTGRARQEIGQTPVMTSHRSCKARTPHGWSDLVQGRPCLLLPPPTLHAAQGGAVRGRESQRPHGPSTQAQPHKTPGFQGAMPTPMPPSWVACPPAHWGQGPLPRWHFRRPLVPGTRLLEAQVGALCHVP